MIKLWQTPFPPFTSWASCEAEFLYLSLSPYHFWFWLEAVYRLWGTVQELNAIPSCLPWLRFTLCHGLGSSCRTDALQFCLLDFLHKGLYSTLTGSRWLVERGKKKKKNPHHVFVIFLTVYGFLWHTDCSWMCKKAGLEVSMRLPSHHSHKNNDALGLVFFSELGVAHAMAHGQAWPAHFPFSSPVSSYSLGKLWTVWVTLEVCHVRSQKLLENHLRATKMHPTLTMYLCLAV